jgi:hypothetical protein
MLTPISCEWRFVTTQPRRRVRLRHSRVVQEEMREISGAVCQAAISGTSGAYARDRLLSVPDRFQQRFGGDLVLV